MNLNITYMFRFILDKGVHMNQLDIRLRAIAEQLKESESQLPDLLRSIEIMRKLGEPTADIQMKYNELLMKRELWKTILREEGINI